MAFTKYKYFPTKVDKTAGAKSAGRRPWSWVLPRLKVGQLFNSGKRSNHQTEPACKQTDINRK